MKSQKNNQKGFTLVELMIAALIFSTVLLLCVAALTQITKHFYKGVNVTRTQEAARSIISTIGESIQFSGSNPSTRLNGPNGSTGFCIDRFLFSYVDNSMFNGTSNHGLVKDDRGVAGCAAVTASQDISGALPNTSRELLLPRMRVLNLDVENLSNNLYTVTVQLGMGEADLFMDGNGNNNDLIDGNAPGGDEPFRCRSTVGSQFCVVTSLSGIFQKRVQ